MLYPLKFNPVYKNYIWGGRGLINIGKELPEGKTAESWEISCHPDGFSVISNGKYKGMLFDEYLKNYKELASGTAIPKKDIDKFPLLLKFIDANQSLSVQVHPDDEYALENEGEYGKNEAWYILSAKPDSKLIYDVKQGVTKESFYNAIKNNRVEDSLNYVKVKEGDLINIPAGLVHAIGEGLILAEIQQNSNSTYRVYDFNRKGSDGKPRPLHIKKALDVIDFENAGRKERYRGLAVNKNDNLITFLLANRYFAILKAAITQPLDEKADGSRFYMYSIIKGNGKISYGKESIDIKMGESVFIPAAMGSYTITGKLELLKIFVPDIRAQIISPLLAQGFTMEDIKNNIAGISE